MQHFKASRGAGPGMIESRGGTMMFARLLIWATRNSEEAAPKRTDMFGQNQVMGDLAIGADAMATR